MAFDLETTGMVLLGVVSLCASTASGIVTFVRIRRQRDPFPAFLVSMLSMLGLGIAFALVSWRAARLD